MRVNRATQEIEPWLADSWTRSDDGRRYTLSCGPNVTFADGHPFTADDVVFSFEAAYDAKAGGPTMADTMMAGGERAGRHRAGPDDRRHRPSRRLRARAADSRQPADPAEAQARRRDEGAERSATPGRSRRRSARSPGSGPFVLSEFTPRQRLVFSRNERYFRKDAGGASLPYLDRIVMDIVPDQDAQMLRLETGQSDMMTDEIRPEDYAASKRAADAGRVQLFDLGVSFDSDSSGSTSRPGAFGKDARASWLQSEQLRHAISLAVDRKAFADTVFLGAGEPVFGPVTPANSGGTRTSVARPPHDPARARQLLATIGLRDRNGDGTLEDGQRQSRPLHAVHAERAAARWSAASAVIRDELKKIGLLVDVVALEGNALVQRLAGGQGYEAAYFQLSTTDIRNRRSTRNSGSAPVARTSGISARRRRRRRGSGGSTS